MQKPETTSWTRFSVRTQSAGEAQLQAWEGEGGMTPLAAAPVRILIADNNRGAADALELMLHAWGYPETRVTCSGHAAIAIAAEFQPDIVLLDISLVDPTGHELARTLREQAQGRDLRVIALTSSREHAAREQARAGGFERYLVRPVTHQDLSNLMETRS